MSCEEEIPFALDARLVNGERLWLSSVLQQAVLARARDFIRAGNEERARRWSGQYRSAHAMHNRSWSYSYFSWDFAPAGNSRQAPIELVPNASGVYERRSQL